MHGLLHTVFMNRDCSHASSGVRVRQCTTTMRELVSMLHRFRWSIVPVQLETTSPITSNAQSFGALLPMV